MKLGEAVDIVKFHLEDANEFDFSEITKAIAKVARMETHNCITKNELVRALRWMFDIYDFGEEDE